MCWIEGHEGAIIRFSTFNKKRNKISSEFHGSFVDKSVRPWYSIEEQIKGAYPMIHAVSFSVYFYFYFRS